MSIVSTLVIWKAASGLEKYCEEYWLKKLKESMNRRTGRRDITEILLGTLLNTIQSINQ